MNIGLVLYPGCVVSGLWAFAELLEVANRRAGKKHFCLYWVSSGQQAVAVTAGSAQAVATINAQTHLLDDKLDALLIPGFWTDYQEQVEQSLKAYQTLVNELAAFPASKPVWAYCSSVSLLAASGRLNHQLATCTWWLADYLQDKYTAVKWNFSQSCIFHALYATAAGVNGYLPIAQELITQHCGELLLREVGDLMVMPKPEKASPAFPFIQLMKLDDSLLRKIVIWVEQTPATELNIKTLAERFNLAQRSLARKVKAATQLSCAHFMRLIKMRQASEYLIYSTKPVNIVSDLLGFSDDAAFRRAFKKVSGYSPGEYRQSFNRL